VKNVRQEGVPSVTPRYEEYLDGILTSHVMAECDGAPGRHPMQLDQRPRMMSYPRHLIVLGAGGLAHEVLAYASTSPIEHIVLVDETAPDGTRAASGGQSFEVVNDWRVFESRTDLAPFRQFIVAVGSPALKRKLVAAALAHGLTPAPTLIHEHANIYGADTTIGVGGVIAPGCRLTTNIRIGAYPVLGINTLIGHDSTLGDYVTCNPGCHVSGNVTIGSGVLIGTGAIVREKILLADDVTIGAQACVVADIDKVGSVVVGVPARPL